MMKIASVPLLLTLLTSGGEAMAADITVPPAPAAVSSSDWRFQATIYGWAIGLAGDVGVAGLGPVAVDVSPSEAIKHLKGALSGSFGGSNGDWMFLTDFIYAKLGDDGVAGNGHLTYDITQKQIIAQGLIGYQLPLGIQNLQLSATAGLRYQHLAADLDLGTVVAPLQFQGSGTQQWVDPTVGLFAHYDFDKHWFVNALGDIGGFGVGSDLTWQAFGTVGYNWSKTISTTIGYRAIYADYKNGGFVYDTTQQGVIAGLGIHF